MVSSQIPPPRLWSLCTIAATGIDFPALAPPEGVESNFDRIENRNGLAIGIITTTMVIGTICVGLRLYARAYLLRKVGLEEGESHRVQAAVQESRG